ncbi:MAG: hypothetical protein ACFFAJ_17155 [Candidatus Hodarchaeota archaeon]
MQEFDIIRVLFYGCCMMVSIATIVKQFNLKGIIGSATKSISFGIFLITGSLLFETTLSFYENIEPLWLTLLSTIGIGSLALGVGFVFYGLWRVSIYFDELKETAKKYTVTVDLDESK